MKKLPIILAATTLAASTFAYADVLRNDASPFAVNVPNVRSGVEINIEGLFLRPTNSDLDYGFVTTTNNPNPKLATSSKNNVLTIKPDMKFAWGVGIGYVFPDSGNDVQFNWTEFNHSVTDTTNLPSSATILLTTPLGQEFPFGTDDIVTASSQAKFKLDVMDLDAGQYIDVGDRLQLRPFAGLRFARVTSDLNDSYVDEVGGAHPLIGTVSALPAANNFHTLESVSPTLITEDDILHSRFSGVGPLFGADANYNLGGGVSAAAHVATALLVGKVDTDSNFQSTEFFLSPPNITTSAQINSDEVWRVVPAFDAKLGLNYSYTFDCDSVVTLEGGYKVTQYIDAVDRLEPQINSGELAQNSVTVPVPPQRGFTTSSNVAVRNTSSLGFSGPYVKLSFKF